MKTKILTKEERITLWKNLVALYAENCSASERVQEILDKYEALPLTELDALASDLLRWRRQEYSYWNRVYQKWDDLDEKWSEFVDAAHAMKSEEEADKRG